MTAETVPPRALDRRFLMRGGAVLAGAAGIAAVGAAIAPTAQAATGQFMVVGQPNSADLSTTITTTDSATTPTLSLVNPTGPTLKLAAIDDDFDGDLAIGEIVNYDFGPLIGVDVGDGVENTVLATGKDLEAQPAPVAIHPERMIDTRDKNSLGAVIGSSINPFDSKGQLKAGAYIDIGLAPVSFFALSAVFINLTAVKPSTAGFLVAYPSGFDDVPITSTVNFQTNVTVANSAFVAVGEVNDIYAIRVYAAKASHVIVDLTGVVFGGESTTPNPPPPPPAPIGARQASQSRRISKMRSAVKKSAGR